MGKRFDKITQRLSINNALEPVTGNTLTPVGLVDVSGNTLPVKRVGAMMSSDFLACETVKIRAIRTLPIKVIENTDAGIKDAITHPLSKALRRPNPFMSWNDLLAWAMLRRDIFGTAYIRVQRDHYGQIEKLWPVLNSVDVRFDKETGRAVYTAPQDRLNPAWVTDESGLVILKTDISEDGGITGQSLAEKAADDIGLSIDLSAFYRSILKNGTHMGGWLEYPGKLGTDDVNAIRQSLDANSGADTGGKTLIFDRGLKYHELEMSIGDLNLIEQERFVLEKICRVCHVDLHHVYADTSQYNSDGTDVDFVKHTILPEITAIEDAFLPVLDYGGVSKYRVDIDTNGLLRGDFKTRMDGYRIGVYAGIFTRAWCCEQEGIPWLPGQDKLLQPTAYYMVDETGEPYVPASNTEGTEGQSDGVSGIEEKEISTAQDTYYPLIKDAMERIKKRIERDGDTSKTRDFIDMVTAPILESAKLAGVNISDTLNYEIDKLLGVNNA